ncbi:DNA (cytosine-5-)-methyltransferase [Amycolatopsis sp. NPDC049159]|uniref:DNA cytosine methyltransferase n=1 Tax=Amycolatopsis sp. NPDC049159 TaxID=3157210 RepID=UPI0033CAF7EB
MTLNVLSLFSGIGGLELGLERAGMTTVGQVELDLFCRSVLERHFPEVPRHDDVRTAPAWWRSQSRPRVDVLAGGFPCQPFSSAGLRRGIGDPRWGWPWMRDALDAVRPRYVLIENVAALLGYVEAFAIVLDDLSRRGFAVEWSVVPACALGAPHPRRRLFVLAYPDGVDGPAGLGVGDRRTVLARHRSQGPWRDPVDGFMAARTRTDRVADGVPAELDGPRITALGNAVVPAVTERIGRLILAHYASYAGHAPLLQTAA